MLGFMLSAAASAAPLPAVLESDVRCLAVIAVVIGGSDNEEYKTGLARAGYFFMGKIAVRDASLDVTQHLGRLFHELQLGPQFDKKFADCMSEVDAQRARMAEAGKTLQQEAD